ncbi:HdeD family acid-resistance protein [Actinomadura roseirufa]|uniref:HdeD family acid-resistance protein n=1 Tax=Actinomadura roseirufa TaxID=2094049 RepID=UPI0013F15CD2|nr:DUF308 domain-containing protein [Actinomadura roseirufa]
MAGHLTGDAWAVALTGGVAALALGLAVVIWPDVTIGVLAVLVGLQLIINGVFRLVQAAGEGGPAGMRALLAVLGALSLAVGVLALRDPFQTATVLAVLFGLFWLIGGVIEGVAVLADGSREGRAGGLLLAALSVVAGIVVLAYPSAGLVALTWLFGLWLITWGIVTILVALWIRGARKRAAAAR